MKTSKIFIMALACMAALSCAKEIDNPSATAPSTNVFTAEKAEFEVAAKSTLQGKKAIWEADDEIAVYAGEAAAVKFTTESQGASVQFKSETEVTGSSFLFAYPYNASKGVQDGKLLLTIPSEQTARIGSFDPHAALSAASATDLTQPVKFKNALSLLKFNIPAELDGKISSITVESKGGEALAGDILLNVADKTNEVSANGTYSVTLSSTQMAQGNYFIAVRPCNLLSGIRVLAWTADGKNAYVRESKACEFLVNKIYDMGDVSADNWKMATVNAGTTVTPKPGWTDWSYSQKPGRYDFYIEPFEGTFTFFWLLKSAAPSGLDAEYRYHVVADNKFDISTSPWSGDSPGQNLTVTIDPSVRNVLSVDYYKYIAADGNEYISFDWILNGHLIHNNISDGIYRLTGTDDFKLLYSKTESGARYEFKGNITISKWVKLEY